MMARKKQQRVYGLISLLIALVAIVWYANIPKKTQTVVRESAVAPETIGGLSTEGKGGDPLLNRQKNRYTIPLDVSEMSAANIIQIPSQLVSGQLRSHRDDWPTSALEYL